jgi:hypothetical protein
MNYLGRRFGRLVCTEHIEKNIFKYNCDCGGSIIIQGAKIHHRNSCGCLDKERIFAVARKNRRYKTSTISEEYRNHRTNAKVRGYIPLTREVWESIAFAPCYYCGETDTKNKALRKSYSKRSKTLQPEDIPLYDVRMNGIDRLDSLKPYSKENCVSCCSMCNIMKNKFAEKDFLHKIKLIYEKHCK